MFERFTLTLKHLTKNHVEKKRRREILKLLKNGNKIIKTNEYIFLNNSYFEHFSLSNGLQSEEYLIEVILCSTSHKYEKSDCRKELGGQKIIRWTEYHLV